MAAAVAGEAQLDASGLTAGRAEVSEVQTLPSGSDSPIIVAGTSPPRTSATLMSLINELPSDDEEDDDYSDEHDDSEEDNDSEENDSEEDDSEEEEDAAELSDFDVGAAAAAANHPGQPHLGPLTGNPFAMDTPFAAAINVAGMRANLASRVRDRMAMLLMPGLFAAQAPPQPPQPPARELTDRQRARLARRRARMQAQAAAEAERPKKRQRTQEPEAEDVEDGTASLHNTEIVEQLKKQLQCPICMDSMTNMSSTMCGHVFCAECILRAIVATHKCPLCKTPLSIGHVHKLFL